MAKRERLISDLYRSEQMQLHVSGDYGRAGDRWAETVHELLADTGSQTVLDYGCGKGFLGEALRAYGIHCIEYDPAIPGKTAAAPADLVVCTDVMEHVEPAKLSEVITHLGEVTRVALFVAISTRPAGKRLGDGRNAHLIIEPGSWWRGRFEKNRFRIKRVWTTPEQEWVAMMRPHAGTI